MSVDSPNPAEQLPSRYRAILDAVADLERRGHRRDAGRIRAEATRAYSRAWDARALRALDALLRDVARVPATGTGRPAARPDLSLSGRTTHSR